MSWPKVKLGDICRIEIGKTPPRAKSEYWGIGYPFLSIKDMNQGKYMVETKEEITDAALQQSNYHLVPKGTLLMSFKLSIGKLGITKVDMYTNEAIAALYVDESRVYKEYLYHALQSIDLLATTDRAVMGATLNKKKLALIPVPLPPLEEQRRITAILDKVNEIEQTSGSVPQQIEMILRSEFDSQFGDPVLNQRSWDEVALESFLETIIDYRGKTPPKSDSGIPLLSAANITNHKLDLSHEQYISQEDYEKWTVRGFTQPGDILITTEAPVGQVALYPEEGIYQISRRMMALRPDSDRADSVFLYFVLSHQNWQKRLTRILRGSTVPRVLKPDLLEQRVILPPIEIQRDFALFVNKMYSLNQLAEEKMESNTNLCNSMIQLLNPMT